MHGGTVCRNRTHFPLLGTESKKKRRDQRSKGGGEGLNWIEIQN
jgi:hypothetical protein